MSAAVLARPRTAARPAARPAQPRNGALAQIHIAKAQLGLDDDTYRDMLWAVARVRSAADLDHAGRDKVLAHLRASGFKPKTKVQRPANIQSADRGPLLSKIEALLLDSGRDWPYADRMAKHMFGVDKTQFLRPDQLHKLVAALSIDARRRAEREAVAATQHPTEETPR